MAKGKRRAGGKEPARQVSQALGPSRRASREKERQRRRRQRRRRTSAFAVLGVVLLLVAGGLLVGKAVRGNDPTGKPKARTQRTLLFAITGSTGAARAVALYAYDPAPKTAALVLIPPNTLSDVVGIGNVVLGNALRLGGAGAARDSVSDLMGVLVDQDWVLTSEAFVALVDRAGGVVVDVDADVVTKGQVVVRAGAAQRLDGATALAYATYVARGQDQVTFQARLQRVLEATFAALPAAPAEIATSITALGGGSRTSWQPLPLAEFVNGVRQVQAAPDGYDPQVLPVTPIETGSGSPAFGIKVDEVATLVHNVLGDSLPPGRDDGDNRVLVLNGVGTPGIGASVGKKLRNEFRVVGSRNKQGFGEQVSVVVVFDNTDPSLAKARRAAELLGLPPTAVRTSTLTQSVADVIVVIGADYKP
jgi:hypothetical protein